MQGSHEYAGREGIAPAGRSSLYSDRAGVQRDVGNPVPYTPTHCADATKAGTPCQARPANGTIHCVGHLRKRGEL